MRRERGFTLIELLVSLALAGLVCAGAFQMHVAFNRQSQRQQQVAEIQQTLRVAMQLIERAIRSAGEGLPSTHIFPGMGPGCTPVNYYGFQFSNDNTYTDPKTTFWSVGTADGDPDWFRVVASDSLGDQGVTLWSSGAVFTSVIAPQSQTWNSNDLFMVLDSCAGCVGQVREVTTGFSGNATSASPGQVKHQKGTSCYNPAPGNCPACDKCLGNFGCAQPGAPIRHFSGGSTVYRIMTSADQGDATGLISPKLTMRTAPFGTAFNDTTYRWVPLADNIEDMQIAVILLDGTVCSNNDNPATCNFANAAAVRVTLVGRSAQPLQGVPASPVGGYEDETASTPASTSVQAYYLRRAMTATIELRNYMP